MVNDNGNGKFGRAMSNGLVATIAWGFVLVIYCTFRAFKIEDPFIGQAFLLLTGAWVGLLTLVAGKKTAKTADKAEDAAAEVARLQAKLDKLAEVAKKDHPEIEHEL